MDPAIQNRVDMAIADLHYGIDLEVRNQTRRSNAGRLADSSLGCPQPGWRSQVPEEAC